MRSGSFRSSSPCSARNHRSLWHPGVEHRAEKIVGEILDESDEASADFERMPDAGIAVRADMDLRRLTAIFELSWKAEDTANSVNGIILERLSRLPKTGDCVHWWDFPASLIMKFSGHDGGVASGDCSQLAGSAFRIGFADAGVLNDTRERITPFTLDLVPFIRRRPGNVEVCIRRLDHGFGLDSGQRTYGNRVGPRVGALSIGDARIGTGDFRVRIEAGFPDILDCVIPSFG